MAAFDSGKSLEKEVLQLFRLVRKMLTELANVRQPDSDGGFLDTAADQLNAIAEDSEKATRKFWMPQRLFQLLLNNLALKLNIQAHDSFLLHWKIRKRPYLIPAKLIKLQDNLLQISSRQLTRLRDR